MLNQLIFGTGRRRFLIYATAIAAFVVLLAFTAKAQTTWTVTVNVSSGKERPVYTLSSNPSGAPNCAGTNPSPKPSVEYLYVCPHDTVNWVAKASTVAYSLTVYFKQPVLDDGTSSVPTPPTQVLHGSNTQPQPAGGPIDNNALPNTYEYSVGVFDPAANHLYVHDPKIIIGTGGGPEYLRNQMIGDCDQLKGRVDADAESDAIKLCKEIDRDVKALENLVKPK